MKDPHNAYLSANNFVNDTTGIKQDLQVISHESSPEFRNMPAPLREQNKGTDANL